MECCSTTGIGQKLVINVCDGAKLGYVTDIEFNTCDGRVYALIVGNCSALGFSKGEAVRVPWDRIKCIGEDTILVEISVPECKCTDTDAEKKKKKGFFK